MRTRTESSAASPSNSVPQLGHKSGFISNQPSKKIISIGPSRQALSGAHEFAEINMVLSTPVLSLGLYCTLREPHPKPHSTYHVP